MNEAQAKAQETRRANREAREKKRAEREELREKVKAGLVSVVEDYEATAAEKLEASRLLLQILE